MQLAVGYFEVAHSSQALYDTRRQRNFADKIGFSAKKSKSLVAISKG
jgi:hypothetical protein